ncbi:MAG: helix-turn-helix domain-containing protein [Archaeoglobaceae archaeon]
MISNQAARILELLASEERRLEEIVKRTRIPKNLARNLIERLVAEGFVEGKGEVFSLTEKGERWLKERL